MNRENRKLCCREDLTDRGWDDCAWYSRYGLFSKDWPSDSCYAGCPDGKIRVAMDESLKDCSQGASVRCCTPRYSTVTKRATAPNAEFDTLLGSFLGDPRCVTEETDYTEWGYQNTIIDNIKTIIYGTPDATKLEIWDRQIGTSYPYLKYASLLKWATSDSTAILLGSTSLPRAILCGLSVYNSQIGGTGYNCACDVDKCGTSSGTSVLDRRLISEWSNDTLFDALEGEFFERSLLKRSPEEYRQLVARSALTGLPVVLTISMMAVSVLLSLPLKCTLTYYSTPQSGSGSIPARFGRRLSTLLWLFAPMLR